MRLDSNVLRKYASYAAVIALAKLIYLALWGVSYEMDTATYLNDAIPAHQPPLYAMFLRFFVTRRLGVWAVAAAQILLFSLAAAVFASRLVPDRRRRLVAVGLLALDPATAFTCVNLMSEALFLPLLLIWISLVDIYVDRVRRGATTWLGWIGFVLAALYSTRLAAIVFVPFVLLVVLVCRPGWKRGLGHALLCVVVFQAFVVPIKLLYQKRWGSYSMTLYSGASLWNSASPLYPDSSVRRQPRTDFEKFLATRDPEEFTTWAALQTDTTNDPERAYDQWVRAHVRSPLELRDFERRLARTAIRIILESPFEYVRRFVLPNYVQPLRTTEVIAIDARVTQLMERRFGYRQDADVVYRPWVWQAYFALLCAATAAFAARRRRVRSTAVLLGFCWYYCLALPWLAAVFIRFLLILAPLILTAAWLQLGGSAVASAGDEASIAMAADNR